MKIKIKRDPVDLIIIENVFSKKINKAILNEAINNKKHFEPAVLSKGHDSSVRNNLMSYYDRLYKNNRTKSVLLNNISNLFTKNEIFREGLVSFEYPFTLFMQTDRHETQVSRYGDSGQKYDWHIDNLASQQRILSFVYYFF